MSAYNAADEGMTELYNGIMNLKDKSPELVSGVSALKDGAMSLSEGLTEFNDKGIKKLKLNSFTKLNIK